MLRIAYVATEEPTIRPKKLTKKQQIHQDAVETLAVRRAYDKIKAKEMFAEERKELAGHKARLAAMIAGKR
jgi:hypothetical protein